MSSGIDAAGLDRLEALRSEVLAYESWPKDTKGRIEQMGRRKAYFDALEAAAPALIALARRALPEPVGEVTYSTTPSEAAVRLGYLTPAPDALADRDAVIEMCARIAERDSDWTSFAREPRVDWTGHDTNAVFSRIKAWNGDFPGLDGEGESYLCGIVTGRVIAAAIRAIKSGAGQ